MTPARPGQMHHIGLGRLAAGTRVTLLIGELQVREIDRRTGGLTSRSSPSTRPRLRTPRRPAPSSQGQPVKWDDPPRHLSTMARDITMVGVQFRGSRQAARVGHDVPE